MTHLLIRSFSLLAAVVGGLTATAATAEVAVPNLAAKAAESYRAQARFPEWSRPLAHAVDPVTAQRVPSRQSLPGPDGAAPALEVWASAISLGAGDSVDLFARLDWLGTDQGPAGLLDLRPQQLSGWAIAGTLIGAESGTIANVSYRDDGRGPDLLAGDGIYSARVTLPADHAPALGQAQNVMVKVAAENAVGDVRRALGGFLYSAPGARLTGDFRQAVVDGNRVVQAQVEVLTAGRYHLAGTLATLADLPVATAQSAAVLEPGSHWMDLPFYGLIFHDLGSAGPLDLASVTLTSANGMPNALGPVVTRAYRLEAVPLDELTAAPFADAALLDAANRLTAAAQP